jgi:hypothetical protein
MKRIIAITVVCVIALTGCGLFSGEGPDFATRVLAGLQCVGAITSAGGQVLVDPDLGFATAVDAFNAISKLATSPGLTAAMAVCKDTFGYLAEDFKGATAMLENKSTSVAEPAAQRKARLSKGLPKAQ